MKFMIATVALLAMIASSAMAQSDADAIVLAQNQVVNPDGSYSYNWETSNGIQAQESGVGGIQASGSFSYTSADGVPVAISYIADENGYQPQGDLLPTPPPTPDYILRAIQYIQNNPPANK